jgi:hypothetical protein
MTDKQQAQLERAREIAQRDGLVVVGAGRTKTGERVYAVPSRSEPSRWHLVVVDPREGRLVCDCPAGQHGRICAHRAAARERLVADLAAERAEREWLAQLRDEANAAALAPSL